MVKGCVQGGKALYVAFCDPAQPSVSLFFSYSSLFTLYCRGGFRKESKAHQWFPDGSFAWQLTGPTAQ